jgi:hypothetical protein
MLLFVRKVVRETSLHKLGQKRENPNIVDMTFEQTLYRPSVTRPLLVAGACER